MKRSAYGGESISPKSTVEDMHHYPAIFAEIGVASPIMFAAFLGQVLPPVALQGDAECGEGEINRITPDFMFKDERDSKNRQSRFSHRLNVCAVAAGPLLSERARLEPVAHAKEGGTTVAAASLSINCSVAFYGKWLLAEGAEQIGTMDSAVTCSGTVARTAQAGASDLEGLPTMLADTFRILGVSATCKRAIGIFARFGRLYRKLFPALGTSFLYLAHAAFPRTEYAMAARTWNKELAAPLTGDSGARWMTA